MCIHMVYQRKIALVARLGGLAPARPTSEDYKVGDLCPCVSFTCKCVNANIGNVEHWMCGESWLAINPPIPVLKAGHPVCILNYCYSIFLWTYNLCLSVWHVVF